MALLGQVGAVLHLLLAGQAGHGTAQPGNTTAAGSAFTSTRSGSGAARLVAGTAWPGGEGFGQLGRIIEALLAGSAAAGSPARQGGPAQTGTVAETPAAEASTASEAGNGTATALSHVGNATARSVLAAQTTTAETPAAADPVPALDLSALADLVEPNLDEANARSLAERSVEAARRDEILQRVSAVAQAGADPGLTGPEDATTEARAALAALDPILGAYGAIALAAVSAGGTPTAALRQRPALFL